MTVVWRCRVAHSRITLFRNADPVVVRALSRCLQPAYYLQHEYIVRKDDRADEIFFIGHGKVDVVSEDGITVYDTMTSGEAFGEVGVMFNVPRSASVRAQVCYVSCPMLNAELS